MHVHGPRNHIGVEQITAGIAFYTLEAAMNNRHSVEMMLDFAPVAYSASGVVAGASGPAPCAFYYTAPAANTDNDAVIYFHSQRNNVTKRSASGEVTLGKRTVLYGKDDGTNVYAWQDGTALGALAAQADWTAAQASYPLLVSAITDQFFVGGTGMRIRFYEFWMKMDGLLIRHYRPKWADRGRTSDLSGTAVGALPDLAGFQDLYIGAGPVEDTDYRFVKAYGKSTP